MDPYSPEGGTVSRSIPHHNPPLTHSRAHQHPLGLPRRRLPASSRFRHLVLLLLECASCSRPQAPQPNRSRPGSIRIERTRIREDTRSRRSKVAGRLRARQGCTQPGQEASRAERPGEPDCAALCGHYPGEGWGDGCCARVAKQTPRQFGCVRQPPICLRLTSVSGPANRSAMADT